MGEMVEVTSCMEIQIVWNKLNHLIFAPSAKQHASSKPVKIFS